MEVSGSYTLYASRERVWARLLDPSVLKRIIPGCEVLELDSPDRFRGRVSIGVAAVKGNYEGTLRLIGRVKPEHLRVIGEGAGTPGVVRGEGVVTFEERGPTTTLVTYVGEAQPDGALASVGVRVLGGVARMLINQFFARLADDLDSDVTSSSVAAHTLSVLATESTSHVDAPLQALPIGQTLPEAMPLNIDDMFEEARALEHNGTGSASPTGRLQEVYTQPLKTQSSSPSAGKRAPFTPASGLSLRNLSRRTGMTDGSVESEQRFARRVPVLVGVIAGTVLALIVFLTRHKSDRVGSDQPPVT